MVQQRSIVTCIILSIVTCGIYGYYWLFKLDEETRQLSNDQNGLSSGVIVLLCIITGGIFAAYWGYTVAKRIQTIKANAGQNAEDNSVLYLVLGIFIFIVLLALVQNEINLTSNNAQ